MAALLVFGLVMLSTSALSSLLLPHLLAWRKATACLPSTNPLNGTDQPCTPERSHPTIDVVSVAVKPTCVTRLAVNALNQYVGPRRIVFITGDERKCAVFRSMGPNVECIPEDEVVPGVTKASVKAELSRRYGGGGDGDDGGSGGLGGPDGNGYMGRENSGWYLQQLLKLGAALHVPNLSPVFLVWDPDMIVLWPMSLLGEESAVTPGRRRVVRHVGGYVIRTYEASYERLTGERLTYAPDGSSYVTHNMVMERRFVEELLEVFARTWTEGRLEGEGRNQSDDDDRGVGGSKKYPEGSSGSLAEREEGLETGRGEELGTKGTSGARQRRRLHALDGLGGPGAQARAKAAAAAAAAKVLMTPQRSGGGGQVVIEGTSSGVKVRQHGGGVRATGVGRGTGVATREKGAGMSGARAGLRGERDVDGIANATGATTGMPAWASAILASLSPKALDLGFSEYGAYASWVAAHHPETVQVAPKRVWSRHPMGPLIGSLGIALQRAARKDGLCCPGPVAVKGMKLMGYKYMGFEVGHVASCGYNNPEHKESYGV